MYIVNNINEIDIYIRGQKKTKGKGFFWAAQEGVTIKEKGGD